MAEGFDSPQRAALAQAIERLRAFDADTAAQESAVQKLNKQRTEIFLKVEAAEAAVAQARDAAVEYLVAQARGDAGKAPETVAQARARLEDLNDQYEATKQAIAALEARRDRPGFGRGGYVESVRQAASAVLATAAPIATMHAEVEELAERFLHKATTLAAVMSMGVSVPGLRRGPSGEVYGAWHRAFMAMSERRHGEPEVLADPAWSDAMTALCTDATAPLPGEASAVVPLKRRG